MKSRSAQVWSLVVVVVLILSSAAAAQEEKANDRALSMLEKGVRQYEEEEYEEATDTFSELLDLEPSSQDMLAMRRQSELQLLVEMSQAEDDELSEVAGRLLEMMTEAVRASKKEVEDPDDIRTELQSPDLDTYLNARVKVRGYGPYAIPELLPLLTDTGRKAQKHVGRAMSTLTALGRQATLPLIAVLKSENEMLTVRAANVLGQVGDQRAVPPLLVMHQDENLTETQRETAGEALEGITGKDPSELGSARDQYVQLISAYLEEDQKVVGHVFGAWAELWNWSEDAEELTDRLTYEEVPSFLYYQRQGSEFALQALAAEDETPEIQSRLVTTMTRELEKARLYADRGEDDDLIQFSEQRVEELEKRIPLVTHLYSPSVVARSLKQAMDRNDSAASYYIVKRLGQKEGVACEAGLDSLTAATHFPDKDTRYRAAVELIKASPFGRVPEPEYVMQVLSAALRQAVQRTALIVSNELQFRNELRSLLKEQDVSGVESDANPAAINETLNLNPSVDVIFVYGNVSQKTFDRVYQKIKGDGRTESKAVYVMRDPGESSPDLDGYEDVAGVLSTDSLRDDPISEVLEEAFEHSTVLASPDAAEAVLHAAEALQSAPEDETRYPLHMAEPALISALGSYDDNVTLAAMRNLGDFGSEEALESLGKAVADAEDSTDVESVGCRAVAKILDRHDQYPDGLEEIMIERYRSENQEVRRAAAEALGMMGQSPGRRLDLIREALQEEGEDREKEGSE